METADSAGNLISFEVLGAYGNDLPSLAGSSVGNRWQLDGFHGQDEDRANGLVHMGARHMVRRDGMWMQPEPLLFLGVTSAELAVPLGFGGVYAGGNPFGRVDRTGKTWGELAYGVVSSTAATAWSYAPGPADLFPLQAVAVDDVAAAIQAAQTTSFADVQQSARTSTQAAANTLRNGSDKDRGEVIGSLAVHGAAAGVAIVGMGAVGGAGAAGLPARSLTVAEVAQTQALATKFNTIIDVVGSRAAGKGRNIGSDLPTGKDQEPAVTSTSGWIPTTLM